MFDRIEPNNNHREQQVRHYVIDRRIIQGTRSEAGQRYLWLVGYELRTTGGAGRFFPAERFSKDLQ